MKKILIITIIIISLLVIIMYFNRDTNNNQEVNVYTSRHYDVDTDLFDKFEEETGIVVNVTEGSSDEIYTKLLAEQDNPQADLVIFTDPQYISKCLEEGLLQDLERNDYLVDEKYQGDKWVGLTGRARIMAVENSMVDYYDITSYSDLIDEKFEGQILVRSSTSGYNIALLSSFIQLYGYDTAYTWAEGIVENMAQDPQGNDRDQVKYVAQGIGDVAILNSYYYIKLLYSDDPTEVEAAEAVTLVYPENTHMSITWGGVVNGANNQEEAEMLLQWLTQEYAQEQFAIQNGEYPLNLSVDSPEDLTPYSELDLQEINYEELGTYTEDAIKIFNEVGWK